MLFRISNLFVRRTGWFIWYVEFNSSGCEDLAAIRSIDKFSIDHIFRIFPTGFGSFRPKMQLRCNVSKQVSLNRAAKNVSYTNYQILIGKQHILQIFTFGASQILKSRFVLNRPIFETFQLFLRCTIMYFWSKSVAAYSEIHRNWSFN